VSVEHEAWRAREDHRQPDDAFLTGAFCLWADAGGRLMVDDLALTPLAQ
jgi:hypothetical protein